MSGQTEPRGEGHSGSDLSEPSVTETDRFGFLLGNGISTSCDGPSPVLVRQQEMKWLHLMSQWEQILEKKTKKVKGQCQKGIPASLRAKCWPLLCAASHRMGNNSNLYESLDSTPGQQSWIDVIQRDTDRQFPFHEMFLSKESHGQQGLFHVLKAYTLFRPDEGYCQAQGPVAAVLLMNMPPEEAFWCLVQISEHYLPGYYSPLLEGVLFDASILSWVLKKSCPAAYRHLHCQGVEPLMFATDWLMCLYSRHLPFDTLLRVWDLFFCYGVRVLFQVAVVLVRRCLGGAAQRRECEGQMETLERLRGVKSHVEHEQADSFVQEVCSVPLSVKELQKQTEKELEKWRKDRPNSTFDPRGRCYGYQMAWERTKEKGEQKEKKEKHKGSLSLSLLRSPSSVSASLSSPIFRRRQRKTRSRADTEGSEDSGEEKKERRITQEVTEESENSDSVWITDSVTVSEQKVKDVNIPEDISSPLKPCPSIYTSLTPLDSAVEQGSHTEQTESACVTIHTHNVLQSHSTQQEGEIQTNHSRQVEEMQTRTEKQEEEIQTHSNQLKEEIQTCNDQQEKEVQDYSDRQEEEMQTHSNQQEEEMETRNDQKEVELQTDSGKKEEETQMYNNKKEEEKHNPTCQEESEIQVHVVKQELEPPEGELSTHQNKLEPPELEPPEEELSTQQDKLERDMQSDSLEKERGTEVKQDPAEDMLLTHNCQQEDELKTTADQQEKQATDSEQDKETEVQEKQARDSEQDKETEVQEKQARDSEQDDETEVQEKQARDNEQDDETEVQEKQAQDSEQDKETEVQEKQARDSEQDKETEVQEKQARDSEQDDETEVQEEQEVQAETVQKETDMLDHHSVLKIQISGNQLNTENQTFSGQQEQEIQTPPSQQEEKTHLYLSKDAEKVEADTSLQEEEIKKVRGIQEQETQTSNDNEEVHISTNQVQQDQEVQEEQSLETQITEGKQGQDTETNSTQQVLQIETNEGKQEEIQTVEGKPEQEMQPDEGKQEQDFEKIDGKQEMQINDGIEEQKTQTHVSQEETDKQEKTEPEVVSDLCEETVKMEEPTKTLEDVERGREREEQETSEEERSEKDRDTTCKEITQASELAPFSQSQPTTHSEHPGESESVQNATEQPKTECASERQRTDVSPQNIPPDTPEQDLPQQQKESKTLKNNPPQIPVSSTPSPEISTPDSNPVPTPSAPNPPSQKCLRRTSSSRPSHPTILSEETFKDPHEHIQSPAQTHHQQTASEACEKQTSLTPETAKMMPDSSAKKDTKRRKDKQKSATLPHPPQVERPKGLGLFRRLRGETTPKINVPTILIQDFSEGEEKLSSRERRRRRREQERREKEEEKERKRREKEMEKDKEKERKKPQTRGKSFQVMGGKSGSKAIPHGDSISKPACQKRNSAPHCENYF